MTYINNFAETILKKILVFDLLPAGDIKLVNDKDNTWEATGTDPQFYLVGRYPQGWVEIEIDIAMIESLPGNMRLYVQRDDSYSEENSHDLGLSGSKQHILLWLGTNVCGLRFDPLDRAGTFQIKKLAFRRLVGFEVALRTKFNKFKQKIHKGIYFSKYAFKRYNDWRKKRGRLPHLNEWLLLSRKALNEWQFSGLNTAGLIPPTGFKLLEPIDSYSVWLEVNQWNSRRLSVLLSKLEQLESQPLLSVIMPVYNASVEFLNKAIESIVNQIYKNWELCIADDASTNPLVSSTLKRWTETDDRIHVVFRQENGNISLATNSAVEIARSEFIILMDQDDELTPDALGEVAIFLSKFGEVDVIYSDDDKITAEGVRFDPQFKPDWSPELLLSYMYFSHLFIIRKSLYEAVGGLRKGFEGSQDYDLALRVTEKARQVGHIPKILYHWRVLPGSTASSGLEKPSSFSSALKALEETAKRRGINAQVYQPDWAVKAKCGIFSLHFPDDGPKVAIIIPTKNHASVLKRCIDSIKKTSYKNYEIIIIDNESDAPETINYLGSLNHKVISIPNKSGVFNYAALNNQAVQMVDAEYILFLNNDTEIRNSQWLSQMVGYLGLNGVGAVGAKLLFPDGKIQHAGIVHGLYNGLAGPAFKLDPSWDNGYLSYAAVARNYLACTAACLLTKRELFLKLGGFDQDQFAVAYNDVDYCYRLHDTGERIVYCPTAELIHYEGLSRGFTDNPVEVVNFKRLYRFKNDPYYNPNLSLDNEGFRINSRTIVDSELGPIRTLMCAFNLNLEGAPYSQYELTVKLRDKGIIDPIVYCPNSGPLQQLYEAAGISVEIFDHPLKNVFTLELYEQQIRNFANRLRDWKVELVYGNTLQTFYAIEAAKVSGVPAIWNPRESEPWQTYFNNFGTAIANRALNCFYYPYKVIFVANATRQGCQALDAHHNFTTIHNGLDRNRLNSALSRWPREKARNNLNIDKDEVMVLLLGTVCERKGQLDLVQALNYLDNNMTKRVRCFIVGNRPSTYSDQLKDVYHSLSEEKRLKLNIIPETSDTALYYSAADIFLCTSRIESYPRVILEAMASGLPIVSTPVFGIREQVWENVNGLFYNPGDIPQLVTALERLINDNNLRIKMAQNSRFVFDTLNDYESMSESYGKLFREAWISGGIRVCVE